MRRSPCTNGVEESTRSIPGVPPAFPQFFRICLHATVLHAPLIDRWRHFCRRFAQRGAVVFAGETITIWRELEDFTDPTKQQAGICMRQFIDELKRNGLLSRAEAPAGTHGDPLQQIEPLLLDADRRQPVAIVSTDRALLCNLDARISMIARRAADQIFLLHPDLIGDRWERIRSLFELPPPPARKQPWWRRLLPWRRRPWRRDELTTLRSEDGTIVELGKRVDGGIGGQGEVFEVRGAGGDGQVCKLLRREYATPESESRLRHAIRNDPGLKQFAWPQALVFERETFKGYLMRRIGGKRLDDLFAEPATIATEHPDWTRRQSTELALSVAQGLSLIHARGIMVGDLQPRNIIVCCDTPSRVVTANFIDCDSFHLSAQYPCPVFDPSFTHPRLCSPGTAPRAREIQDELFAFAILVFYILIPGQHPFNVRGGRSPAENMRSLPFPYSLDRDRRANIPVGPWFASWTHLSPELHALFSKSFDMRHPEPCPEVSLEQWINVLGDYAEVLRMPGMTYRSPLPQFDLNVLPAMPRRTS